MERSSRGVHLLPLVDPLVLSELGVEGPLLQPSHLQSEPRSQLLLKPSSISGSRFRDEILLREKLDLVGRKGLLQLLMNQHYARGKAVSQNLLRAGTRPTNNKHGDGSTIGVSPRLKRSPLKTEKRATVNFLLDAATIVDSAAVLLVVRG